MKKTKRTAFTPAEILVVLSIIGVMSVMLIPTIGNKISKNKAMFKKAYSLAERTIVELVNDEMYYPYDYNNFGFKETSDVNILGADYYTSTIDYNKPVKKPNINWNKSSADLKKEGKNGNKIKSKHSLVKFCNLFSNNLNTNAKPAFKDANNSETKNIESIRRCKFTTQDGITWSIYNADSVDNIDGFLIYIDVNGSDEPNAPALETIRENKNSQKDLSSIKNRDRYYMFVRYDGKMQLPDNDTMAKEYLKSADFRDENK